MLKKIKIYLSWMMSVLLCFNNSFAVIQAEENTQNQEYKNQEAAEDQPIEEESDVSEISDEESINSDEIEQDNEAISDEERILQEGSDEEVYDPAETETVPVTEENSHVPEETSVEESSVFETPASDFTYTINNGEVTITNYKGKSKEVEIPETINDYPVTNIGQSAFYESSTFVTSIKIPNSVTNIEANAFSGCKSLTNISLSDNLTCIENGTFTGCTSLTGITIPASVASIKDDAFSQCPEGLLSINVHPSNQFYDSRNDCNAIIETATNTLVLGCRNTIIPDGVTRIGNRAFYHCESLKY